MKIVFLTLLPVQADNTICGMKLPIYVFACLAVISTVRSCIHVFAPDGGAGSIAGMDPSVAGARCSPVGRLVQLRTISCCRSHY